MGHKIKIAFISIGDSISSKERLFPPLGLLYLASVARERGCIVDFFDYTAMDQTVENIVGEINEFAPDICALSLYTGDISAQYRFISTLKVCLPGCTVIVGGPHASALPERTMEECKEIDFLVFGEGEITFDEIIESMKKNEKPENIDGVCYRRGVSIIKNRPRELITDLDSIPFPAYDLIYKKGYQYPNRRTELGDRIAVMISSRGCPWNCTFCYKGIFGTKYRRRSVGNVINEILLLVNEYGVNDITFVDDLFAVNRKWLTEFCRRLRLSGINIHWKCMARVNTLTKDDMLMMKESGCYCLEFGVESGNEEVLKDVNKKITVKEIRSAFKSAKEAGLITAAFFIIGNRLDTKETVYQTMTLAKEIRPDFCNFMILMPLPGSRVYQLIQDNIKYNWELYSGYYLWSKNPVSLCSLSSEELRRYCKQAFVEYYGRFRYLISNSLMPTHHIKIRIYQAILFCRFFGERLWLKLMNRLAFPAA